MKFNKTLKKSLLSVALLAGVASTSVQADTFTFTVDTISPVAITERQALAFGSQLKLTPGGVCGFAALVADTDDWVVGDTNFALLPALAIPKAVTGSGCADAVSTTSNLGHYLISGAATTPIKITLVSGGADDGTSFTFAPAGLADNAPNLASGGAVIAADTQTSVTSDASGNIGLLVGGTITVGINPLTSGSSIPASFDINVVY